mgnify:CR=1 FL=1
MHRNSICIVALIAIVLFVDCKGVDRSKDRRIVEDKTIFQTGARWNPDLDNRADAAIIYGTAGRSFEERVESWRSRGYNLQFMTGIAWGEYQDYFLGKWDGSEDRMREGQKAANGDTIWHGPTVPYVVPTDNFIEYIKETQVKRAIDAGITVIHLEEPEFWMRAGYSEAFKEEWQKYYGFPWRAQHESPENTYLSNKLKYHLYYNALDKVFTYAKEYGKSKGLDVKCFVPTHSLINYTSWRIVSPEASLASLDCIDGYIAQVWTGTSREPTFYNGVQKERVFENAFLEYGCMQSMTAPTGRQTYFLTDPIEDWPRDWDDYKINYQATFTAQLLYPMIDTYEVMPWPERIYQGLYLNPATNEKERISRDYSTQMHIMINSLNDIQKSENKVSGTHGFGVLMANSMMFQRYPTHAGYDDPQFASFYGQTFPLLKRGVPVDIIHIENTPYKNALKDIKVLMISYSNMKPLESRFHDHIAEWVKKGGVVVYCGEDQDPYQTVMEWWNTDGNMYESPSEHLFERMGLSKKPAGGKYSYGKGAVYIVREDPKNFVLKAANDSQFIEVVSQAYAQATKGKNIEFKNNLYLERGPYVIAAVMDESVSEEPMKLTGLFIDLFDKNLPVLKEKIVNVGQQTYLYNLQDVSKKKPKVLCGASRVYEEVDTKSSYTFVAKSPANSTNISRVRLPQKPTKVLVSKKEQANIDTCWDEESSTYLLTFENNPDGVSIAFSW